VPGQRLIDAVVDDFMSKVVRPSGVGVHAGAATHRLESGQDFDVRSTIRSCHSISLRRELAEL
jgi:hypothetical protein